MKTELQKKCRKLVEAEMKAEINHDLLDELRNLASLDTIYDQFGPGERNALNQFFKELREVMINELIQGNYGASIIMDAMIVTAFEVGCRFTSQTAETQG